MSQAVFEFAPMEGDCTVALQEAIKRCAASGEMLVLNAGLHLCAGLRMVSNLHLHLSEGAILRMQAGYEYYADNEVGVIAEDSNLGMLVASRQSNITLSGSGLIEALGEEYIIGALEDMGTHIPAQKRPRTLVIEHCNNVCLKDFSIKNSPMWTIHLVNTKSIEIERLKIDNDRKMPNTDGIVIDACEGVTIRNCDIATADDGIVLKTSAAGESFDAVGHCRDVKVNDCVIESHSCALKLGTESFGDFENIHFVDCTLRQSNRAIGIFSRDGGKVDNVSFERVSVECKETPEGFWGSGEAITVNCVDRRAGRQAGKISNIRFIDITGVMEGAINLIADSLAGIEAVEMKNVKVKQSLGAFSGGRYDVRPTHFDLEPSPDAAGRANAWIKDEHGNVIGLVAYPGGQPGFFASNVKDLNCENLEIERPSPLPDGWSSEAIVILQDQPNQWTKKV